MENELNVSLNDSMMYDSIASSLNKKRDEYVNILAKIKNMNVSSSFEDIKCIVDDLIRVQNSASKTAICNVLLKHIAAVHISVQRMITTLDDTAEWLNAICKHSLLPSNEVQSIMKSFNFRQYDNDTCSATSNIKDEDSKRKSVYAEQLGRRMSNLTDKFTKFDAVEDVDMSSLDDEDVFDDNDSVCENIEKPNTKAIEENVKHASDAANANDPCNPWPFNETILSCNDASKTNVEASALSNSCVANENDANQQNSRKTQRKKRKSKAK